jgi:hypothetical protein
MQVDIVSSALPTGAATEATLANVATEATLSSCDTSLSNIDTNTNGLASELQEIKAELQLSIVDFMDTPLLDTSSTNIPASASNPVEVVASTAAVISKIQSFDDIGSWIGVYTGAAMSEVLVGILGLGGGEIEVNIAQSTRISLRNMENSAISSGKIAINFIG